MAKPTILIDCDGVLSDFIGGICSRLNRLGMYHLPEEFTAWDFKACLPKEHADMANTLASRPGFCYGLTPYESTYQTVASLRDLGASVLCVTAPWASASWPGERIAWLQDHFKFNRHDIMLVSGNQKPRVAGDVLIEDHPDTVNQWCDAHPAGHAILVSRPWNQKVKLHARATRALGREVLGRVASLLA